MRSLPSLNHLRSFQIIGRHLNLVRAAADMNLTSSALSHQLGVLESQLGTRLFTRNGRGLSFTTAGRELHLEVDACLTRLAKAIEAIGPQDAENTLVVNALPTFAMRWLLPRFASFEKNDTLVEIRVSTRNVDFVRDGIDCAIYYGHEGGHGFISEFLREESLIVVCAPSFITEAKPLATPADLAQHQLLRTPERLDARDRREGWNAWLHAAGMPELLPAQGLVLETRNLLIQAAKSGLGVAVVDPLLVRDELASGQLIQPIELVAKSSCPYYLVYPSTSGQDRKILAFRDWLIRELHREE
jgi:LysR family glycine cleavage system transcriptional activator